VAGVTGGAGEVAMGCGKTPSYRGQDDLATHKPSGAGVYRIGTIWLIHLVVSGSVEVAACAM